MNRITWIAGIIVILIALAGSLLIIHIQHAAPPTPAPAGTPNGNAAVGANGASFIITYTDAGFAPAEIPVSIGTTITWDNESSHALWIEGTGPDGGDCTAAAAADTLNECTSVQKGGTYSHTFTAAGSFPYFNHERSTDTGIITVTADAVPAGVINPNALPE